MLFPPRANVIYEWREQRARAAEIHRGRQMPTVCVMSELARGWAAFFSTARVSVVLFCRVAEFFPRGPCVGSSVIIFNPARRWRVLPRRRGALNGLFRGRMKAGWGKSRFSGHSLWKWILWERTLLSFEVLRWMIRLVESGLRCGPCRKGKLTCIWQMAVEIPLKQSILEFFFQSESIFSIGEFDDLRKLVTLNRWTLWWFARCCIVETEKHAVIFCLLRNHIFSKV